MSAQLELLEPVVQALAPRATLQLVEQGDHSFKVPRSTGEPGDVFARLCDVLAQWSRTVVRG